MVIESSSSEESASAKATPQQSNSQPASEAPSASGPASLKDSDYAGTQTDAASSAASIDDLQPSQSEPPPASKGKEVKKASVVGGKRARGRPKGAPNKNQGVTVKKLKADKQARQATLAKEADFKVHKPRVPSNKLWEYCTDMVQTGIKKTR